MRYLRTILTCRLVASMLALHAGTSIAQARLAAVDMRPVGKYLYALCSLDPTDLSPCERVDQLTPDLRRKINKMPQKITVTQVCDLDGGSDCTGIYPVVKGGTFYLKASSDSGDVVTQTKVAGPAERMGAKGAVVQYHVTGTGTIMIRADGAGSPSFLAPPPVDLLLQSVEEVKAATATTPCALIPATAPSLSQANPVDATALVALLGNPTPFLLTAPSSQVIAIYTTRQGVKDPDETNIYNQLIQQIKRLSQGQSSSLGTASARAAKPFSVVLRIPHAPSLGDLVTRFSSLNYSQFTLQDVGRDELRITSTTTPDCAVWKAFLDDLKRVEWQVVSSPMNAKLFYLSASDVATAYTGLSPAATSSGSSPTTTGGGSTSAAPAAAASSSTGVSGLTTISASQPPGTTLTIQSDGTSCVTAGLIAGSSVCGTASATSPSSSAPAATSSVTPAPLGALQMNAMSVITGTTEQIPPDILIFNDAVAGDDAQAIERMRILAQLDLPRPEMIFTAWVAQNSSTKQEAVAAFSDRVQSVVRLYNDEFERLIERGWKQLKFLADGPSGTQYYNRPFMRYVSDLYIADTYKAPDPKLTDSQQLAQNYLDYSAATIAEPADTSYRETHKICPKTQYCLGYTSLFRAEGIEPRLTDLLLVIVAAQDPLAAANAAVAAIQGNYPSRLLKRSDCNNDHCKAMWDSLSLEAELRNAGQNPDRADCAALDQLEVLDAAVVPMHEPNVRLHCFSQKAQALLATDESAPPPNHVGLLRAAIANFLFNYKMSQEFPHEFVPYDLTTSANDLNNQLGPLIEAFNDDLKAYQLFVRADLQYQAERLNSVEGPCCVKRLFGLDKPSFYNDALVTVRTISGQATTVNTTSQSTLNASLPPSVSALVSAAAAGAASGSTPVTPGQRLAAAIAQFQTTSVQVGRSLNVNITPRALSTASSAEITVSLLADDSANSPLFSGTSSTDAAQNNSRVSQHDVTTRVRVNSIKLFNLSSFTAVVERSHGRFPLLPPFIEVPYIGTFAGIPLGAAREFHSSNAIISAYVVPTAADLAFGLRFQHDLLVDSINPGPCRLTQSVQTPGALNACVYRPIYANRDIGINKPSLSEFNRQMVWCLRSNTRQDGCSSVSFDDANALANY